MPGKPHTHIAYALKRESRTSWRWLEIGVATCEADGKSFVVNLDRLPIGGFNGRVYIRAKDLPPQLFDISDLPENEAESG